MTDRPPSQNTPAEMRAFTDAIWEAVKPALSAGRITGDVGIAHLFVAAVQLGIESGLSAGEIMQLYADAYQAAEDDEYDGPEVDPLIVTTGKRDEPS